MRHHPIVTGLLVAACSATKAPPALPAVGTDALRSPADFATLRREGDRSRALFLEASRVFLHPRCSNCHPDGEVPLQGMEAVPHEPPVTRGPADHGVPGLECASCHQDHNVEGARVPGAPHWHLAPREMAWVGKTPGEICAQLQDPERNGGKTLEQIVEHSAHDELVGWGWDPGDGRQPAPGTQVQLGELVAAWVETGALCPEEGR
jgi:hypothetical protein